MSITKEEAMAELERRRKIAASTSSPVNDLSQTITREEAIAELKRRNPTLQSKLMAGAETAAALASGLGAGLGGGLAYIPAAIAGGDQAGQAVKQGVQEALTYQPENPLAQQYLQNIAEFVEPVGSYLERKSDELGEAELARSGDPLAATLEYMAPQLALEGLSYAVPSLAAARLAKPVTASKALEQPLIDAAARNKLVREGRLDAETAGYQTVKPVPDSDRPVPTAGLDPVQSALEAIPERPTTLLQALPDIAPAMLTGKARVVESATAKEAKRQGIPPQQLNVAREADKATLAKMKDVLAIRKQGMKSRDYASNHPTYIVIGQSFDKRLNTVMREKAKTGERIGAITKEFEGQPIEFGGVVARFADELEANRIGFDGEKLDFGLVGETSPLSNSGPQRTLKKVLHDLQRAESAADLHRLKRDIDKNVSYQKGGLVGVDDTTESIMKAVRTEINKTLSDFDPRYAEANATYAEIMDALENLTVAMPKMKKMPMDTPQEIAAAQKYIGQQLKKTQTNYSNKEQLNLAIIQFDELAKKYGGDYTDDIGKLVAFEADLATRFGDPLASTFQSRIESANTRSITESRKAAWKKLADRKQGITDENAMQSLENYLQELMKR